MNVTKCCNAGIYERESDGTQCQKCYKSNPETVTVDGYFCNECGQPLEGRKYARVIIGKVDADGLTVEREEIVCADGFKGCSFVYYTYQSRADWEEEED